MNFASPGTPSLMNMFFHGIGLAIQFGRVLIRATGAFQTETPAAGNHIVNPPEICRIGRAGARRGRETSA
jgi:hypothetical protein